MNDGKLDTPSVEAERWIITNDDLDAYVAACSEDEELWLLARAMAEDAHESGYGAIDPGRLYELIEHFNGAEIVSAISAPKKPTGDELMAL